MNDAFYIAATGMQAQQMNVETIANNLANVNTAGFKKSRVSFADMVQPAAAQSLASEVADSGVAPANTLRRAGTGVGIASLTRLFDAGELKRTDAPLDIAIQGNGFIEVTLPDGSSGFTRGGSLKAGRDGQLMTQAGMPLKSGIVIPSGAQNITITSDGRVQINVAGQATPIEVGQIELVRFSNPAALAVQGDNLYRATEPSGEAIAGKAGEESMGFLSQGMLEASNVKMVDEMVNLMVAQRGYEASVKVVQAADEMASLINGLRK